MTASKAEPPPRSALQHRGGFLLVLTFLLGISLAAEFTSYARPDTGFLLDAAARVLDGARLYVDIVEINPPLIIAFNMIAVLSSRLLGVSDILAYRLGCAAMLLSMLVLSGWVLRRLLPDELLLRRAVLLLLAFVLFPLAGQDFGEREHLVLALLLPYLFLTALRSLGGRVASLYSSVIGLLAGLAFALKPQFLILWVLVEGYLRTGRREGAKVFRPETLAIAGLLVGYGVAVLALTPQYLGLVRLLAGPYNRFLYDPFFQVLVTGSGAVLAIFALLAFAALRPHARNPGLWQAIALGTAACLVAGAAQQKGLRYHLYPSFALGTVLLGLIAWDTVRPVRNGVRLMYRWLASSVLAASVIVVCAQNVAATLGADQDSDRVQFEELVRLLRARAAGESVFVMSYHLRSAYPLINYSGVRSASRFPHLWILAAEYRDELESSELLAYHRPSEMSPSERYLNQAVLEDLRGNRPRLLVVFRPARDLPVNGLRRLDYIAYFNRDPRIERILADYQLTARLRDYLVYERLTPGATRSGPPPTVVPATQDVVGVRESGLHLRLSDPTFVMAVLTFLISLMAMPFLERGHGQSRQLADARPRHVE